MLSHHFGILDNDPKGLTGTKFYAEFLYHDKKVRHEYFIGDVISNKSSYTNYLKELEHFKKLKLEEQKQRDELLNSQKEKLKEEKEKLIENKLDQLDPILIEFMNEALKDESKVQSYLNGNEKIINAMVGMVIKNAKSSGLKSFDPEIIKNYLIKRIKQL